MRVNKPFVSYRFRFTASPNVEFAVEVNCSNRSRRDRYAGAGAPNGDFEDIGKYTVGYREEVDFVCDWADTLWRAGYQIPAQDQWTKVSEDGSRQVRVDTLRTTRPNVTYAMQYVDSGGGRGGPNSVEVNCETRERRESNGRFLPAYTPQARQEVDYVCGWAVAHWQATSPQRQATPPAPPIAPNPQQTAKAQPSISTGSGFVVSPRRIVTNQHVVDDCTSVSVRFGDHTSPAKVVASTSRNDLALLAFTDNIGIPVAVRAGASLGEDLTVAGFPLAGLLSSDLIVTSGQVNSMAGLGNDPTMLQISAPVQPGNSGGPLLDRSGSVVGVVVSKLNVEQLAKVTGDLAQNVNFAIKPEVLRLFLDTNRVQYRTAAMGPRLDGIVLAERARHFTVQVLCEK